MAEKHWSDKYIVDQSVPGTIVEKEPHWADKYLVPGQDDKKKRFVPSIGGEDLTPFGKVSLGPIDVEYPRSIKSALGAAFGGPATRGMPFIKDIIPTTAKDVEHMEKFPKTEKGMNIAGSVVGTLPIAMAMPFGTGAAGVLGNATTQAGLNAVLGTTERAVHEKKAPIPDAESAVDAAAGFAGPVLGKAISPFQHGRPNTPGPYDRMVIQNMPGGVTPGNMARWAREHGATNNAQALRQAYANMRIDRAHGGIDRALDIASINPMIRWGLPAAAGAISHGLTGSVAMDLAAVAAGRYGPGALRGYIGNQAMGPGTQAILNSMLESTSR